MDATLLIPLLGIFSVLFIPILGLTIILTTRFALKPLAETLANALRDSGGPSPSSQHLQALADEVEALRREVHQLKETQEFDRELLESPAGSGSYRSGRGS
jgi:hypothetical protein